MNRVLLVGNLCQDVTTRYTTGGQAVADLRLATDESYNGKDGKRHKAAEFHSIVVWGKQAVACGQFLKKGRKVSVEGRLRTRSYEKDGVKFYKTEVIATHVDFLSSGQKKETTEPVTA